MTAAWARPLEQLFGAPLDGELSSEVVRPLVDGHASEGDQLDFKVQRYATDEKGSRELAKDVCAFANHLGGVLLLGVAEVNGVASAVNPISDVGDADARHIRSVVASWCGQVPELDVVPVRGDGGQGFIVIAVPPSPRAPHAVAPPKDPSFSRPVGMGPRSAGSVRPSWQTPTEAVHRGGRRGCPP